MEPEKDLLFPEEKLMSDVTSSTCVINNNGNTVQEEEKFCPMTYAIFVLQGIGTLLPWYFFITAHEYYRKKFTRNSTLKNDFEEAFSISSTLSKILAVVVNVLMTGRISHHARVVPSLVLTAVLFTLTAVLVHVDSNDWTQIFFAITIMCIVLINAASGFYESAVYGIAGALGPRYTQGVMLGQGFAGLFSALASIVAKAGNGTVERSSFSYFLLATIVTIICGVGYRCLFRTKVVNIWLSKAGDCWPQCSDQTCMYPEVAYVSPPSYFNILRLLFPAACGVALCFVVTLSLYPGIISNIRSFHEDSSSVWTGKLFASSTCFLIYGAADTSGRVIAGYLPLFSRRKIGLCIFACLRFVFIPLFLMCNYQPRNEIKVFFNDDYSVVIINTFFSVTNGYLGCLCMMYGPKMVPPEQSEVAGTLMNLSLQIGLCIGAALSFGLAEVMYLF